MDGILRAVGRWLADPVTQAALIAGGGVVLVGSIAAAHARIDALHAEVALARRSAAARA